MVEISKCTRDTLCVDCDDLDCWNAGSIEADCPKWKCDSDVDCECCDFMKRYQEDMRKYYKPKGEK